MEQNNQDNQALPPFQTNSLFVVTLDMLACSEKGMKNVGKWMAGWFSLWMLINHLKSPAMANKQKESKYKGKKSN